MATQNHLVSVPRGVEVSAIGLRITAKLSYEQWSALVESLHRAHRSLLWFIGDALCWGEENFGEEFSQVISEYSKQVQYNAAWVSRQIELSRRREGLSWSHHYEVAKLDAREQDAFLEAAIDNGWSTRELREAVRGATGKPATARCKIKMPDTTEPDYLTAMKSLRLARPGPKGEMLFDILGSLCWDFERIKRLLSESEDVEPGLRWDINSACNAGIGAILTKFFEPRKPGKMSESANERTGK